MKYDNLHSISPEVYCSWKVYKKEIVPKVNKKDPTNEKERGLDYEHHSVLFSCSNFWEKQLSASQHTYVENRKCPERLQWNKLLHSAHCSRIKECLSIFDQTNRLFGAMILFNY